MHPNPIFAKTSREENIEFARGRSFGTLAVNGAQFPLLSHIPFQLSGDGSYLEAHLVRSNPIARLPEMPVEAVVAVSGSDAYISPDWYGADNQVPTWNYVAVHISGTLERLADSELRGILDRLSAAMETRLAPKPAWTIDKMDPDVFAKMSRMIVPVGMNVTDIQGTWKLSQNKSPEMRKGASHGLESAQAAQVGSGLKELIRLMGAVSRDN